MYDIIIADLPESVTFSPHRLNENYKLQLTMLAVRAARTTAQP